MVSWSLYTLDTMAMVTIGFVSTFSEPQNIEQGISNVEVTRPLVLNISSD